MSTAAAAAPTGAGDLRPAYWLRNPHVQSMLASTAWRARRVRRAARPLLTAARELLLDCGAGVRLQCFISAPPQARRGPVLLLHGWEGSADSFYVLSLGALLFAQGHTVARLNLRDHGATHHLNRELFHSCRLPEVVGAVAALQRVLPGPLTLIGFSLGGNFMLRVAAQARTAQLSLAQVIAVSPVLDPAETLAALQGGLPGYEYYFVRKWLRSLRLKHLAWPGSLDPEALGRLRDLKRMTAELVRAHTEYPSLDAYLEGYSITGARLAGLEVRSTIYTAQDDPIIPAGGLARLARPAALRLVVTRYGGHCGFFQRLRGPTWLEREIIAQLA
ncbi:MAG: alpha/beta fold hydrolase [Gammaproteobacteria bacterium]|nr:alpha/beta fold hydrolase [Gammaproteobacteria bacterium]